MHIHSLVDQKIRQIKVVKTHRDRMVNGQTGNGNGAGNGNGNGNGAGGGNGNGGGNSGGNSGGESFISFITSDVRKMPDGRYGVYADKFKNKKRVMTPGGKHAKELKKVYKNKKDANDYMARL